MTNKEKAYPISTEDLWTILDSLHDEIMIYDHDYTLVYVNNAALRHYGKKPADMIGSKFQMLDEAFWGNSTLPEVYKKKKLVAKRQITNLGLDIITISTPVLDEAGNIRYVAMNVNDIYNYLDIGKAEDAFLKIFAKPEEDNEFLYASESMAKTVRMFERLKNVSSPCLIIGETGTGKSQLARHAHLLSNRAQKPFVAVNCACMNPNLIESELFGYKKGAFSGANPSGKKGIVQIADGGTLFLDEISEIPLELQGKLLQFIQDKEFMPLGSEKKHTVDVRIIAATNKDLRQMAKAGTFREDLYYRLNTFEVTLPPLRERPEDIVLMIDYYLQKFNREYLRNLSFSDEARSVLLHYQWPGNVRELSHIMEKTIVLADKAVICPEDLPRDVYALHNSTSKPDPQIQTSNTGSTSADSETFHADGILPNDAQPDNVLSDSVCFSSKVPKISPVKQKKHILEEVHSFPEGLSLREALEETERRMVTEAYRRYKNSTKTASALGVSQPTAYRLIKKHCT